jgi:UDP-N-acetyl-2-amino-2-deoxyglucuronate dehydrogenase
MMNITIAGASKPCEDCSRLSYNQKTRRAKDGKAIDCMTICSPNHLHDAHIRLALRIEADAICDKPLVLNLWNLDFLQKLEEEYGKRVWTNLQLRVHPSLLALKEKLENEKK